MAQARSGVAGSREPSCVFGVVFGRCQSPPDVAKLLLMFKSDVVTEVVTYPLSFAHTGVTALDK